MTSLYFSILSIYIMMSLCYNYIQQRDTKSPLNILKKAFEIWQEEINRSCDFQLEFLSLLDITEKEVVFNKPSHELEEEVKNFK